MNIKETNGITLVALVITIIILLILAGVAVATLGGNGNILDNANKAVDKYNSKAEEEEQILGTLEDKLKEYFGGETPTTTLEMEMPDNVIKANSMEYISPGSSYQLALKKSGTPVSASDVKWSSDNGYVQIDANGLLTLSDDATYGNAVIKAEYQGETVEHLLVTLHRIKLGSEVETTAYQQSGKVKLFASNTFKINNTLNLGMVPGESGYSIIPLKYTSSSDQYARYSLLDLRNDIVENVPEIYWEAIMNLRIGIEENNVVLPMKSYVTVYDENGKVKDKTEINKATNSSNLTSIMNIGPMSKNEKYYIRVDLELKNWNELTSEELQTVINLMSTDTVYTASCNILLVVSD